MAFLLDTHAVLWALDPRLGRLSTAARNRIVDGDEQVFVSSVSAFEIATKHAIGKMPEVDWLLGEWDVQLASARFAPLVVNMRHGVAVAQLPLLHRDPFDRLLIAQALVEGLTLVSNETLFDRYGVRRLW